MAKDYEMTWNAKARRWFKKQDGTQYSIASGKLAKLYPSLFQSATKEGSRQAANQWWRDTLATVAAHPQKAALEAAIEQREKMAHWCELEDRGETRAAIVAEVATLRKALDEKTPVKDLGLWLDPLWQMGAPNPYHGIDKGHWIDAVEQVEKHHRWQGSKAKQEGLDELAKQFLDSVEGTPRHVADQRKALDDFRKWLGHNRPEFNPRTLSQWRSYLKDQTQWSDWWRKRRMLIAIAFLKWLWIEEIIDSLPRNIDDKKLKFKVEVEPGTPWTDAEVKKMLKTVRGRSRLYCLLALNCGMYAGDIGQLKKSQVDWERGRIKRGRSKTKVGNELWFQLWPETFELLKKHSAEYPHDTLALATRTGEPLWRSEAAEGHKEKKANYVSETLSRFKDRHNLELPPLMNLRHTGRTKIDNHPSYGRYARAYLQHSKNSVDAKHYEHPSQEQFDDTLHWLGQQFGLVKK